jgi:hypothetical protein
MKINKYFNGLIAGVLLSGLALTSCEDQPDAFELTGGTPEILYVRMPYLAQSDSLITEASLQSIICLVGNNLTSIQQLYFNDQKAQLNSSYITDHTLIVQIPAGIPNEVSDKLYMINEDKDTTVYDFHVIVPKPIVTAMSCEYAKAGEEVTIYGNYFIDDPNVPLTVVLPDGQEITEFTNFTQSTITFPMPVCDTEGSILVNSIYGKTTSSFKYLDSRGIIFDFDGTHGGLTGGQGWRAGNVRDDDNSLDGGYLYFGGPSLSGEIGGSWEEDAFCINYWPNGASDALSVAAPQLGKMLENYSLDQLQLKFEVCVPAASSWSSCAMQIMFTSDANVTMGNAQNQYYGDANLPRALWMPWTLSGSYDTGDKWVTVSIPMTSFNKTHLGQACDKVLDKSYFTGLTLFVWHGGVAGTDCTPEFFIDNIRVVPLN